MTGPDRMLLAHGVGGRQDLPIPFSFALTGAALALVVSFAVLGFAWRTPRLRQGGGGYPAPPAIQRLVDSRPWLWAWRAVGLAATAYVGLAAVAGPDDPLNPTAGIVYVWFWVGVPLASVLVGPLWRALNPLRTLHLAITRLAGGRQGAAGLAALPQWVGYWPAAAGLAAFTWLELVAPDGSSTQTLRIFFAAYGSAHLLAAMVFGSQWFDHGDAFEAYSTLLGRLSPLGRRTDGRLVLRNPLDGLDGITPAPGLVAVACVLLGSTAYDSLSTAPWWIRILQSGAIPEPAAGTLGWAAGIAAVSATYVVAALAAGRLSRPDRRRLSPAARAFAHSLVPIVLGYVIAHYYTLLVVAGQHTLVLASDPRGTGANWFGTAGWGTNLTLVTPTGVATLQVAAVLAGHVLGVVSAHERAMRLFPRDRALAGQLPLLVLMIGYTVGGLSMLFAV